MKFGKIIAICIIPCLYFCKSAGSRDDTLVRIAIVPFQDLSASPDLAYLSISLTGATEKELRRIYRFESANPDRRLGAGVRLENLAAEARSLCIETRADVCVYGMYQQAGKSRVTQAEIAVEIVLTGRNKTIGQHSNTVTVDARIFNEVDEYAASIVRLITRFQKEIGQADSDTPGPKPLTRKGLGIIPFVPPIF